MSKKSSLLTLECIHQKSGNDVYLTKDQIEEILDIAFVREIHLADLDHPLIIKAENGMFSVWKMEVIMLKLTSFPGLRDVSCNFVS